MGQKLSRKRGRRAGVDVAVAEPVRRNHWTRPRAAPPGACKRGLAAIGGARQHLVVDVDQRTASSASISCREHEPPALPHGRFAIGAKACSDRAACGIRCRTIRRLAAERDIVERRYEDARQRPLPQRCGRREAAWGCELRTKAAVKQVRNRDIVHEAAAPGEQRVVFPCTREAEPIISIRIAWAALATMSFGWREHRPASHFAGRHRLTSAFNFSASARNSGSFCGGIRGAISARRRSSGMPGGAA